jgi:hypothetical protein
MKVMLKVRGLVGALALVSFVSGCASNPSVPAGTVQVSYSQYYPDGSYLKEVPSEVTIVTRAKTAKGVAGSVGLSVLTMATFGAAGAPTFSKNDLKGDRIEAADRRRLNNPISTEFTKSLGEKINATVQGDPTLRDKQFSRPVFVAGGSVRLVYDTLVSGDETFRLATELKVWRAKNPLNPISSPYVIDCDQLSSEAKPQAKWAEQDYQTVETQLTEALAACEQKVLAALPKMLQ